jgi:UDP-N-acetylglucosamine--N-acetylmuramyl-(pentapeptide) pyrophosphoryl-undecaprenol N-acetylglucosamine transferase
MVSSGAVFGETGIRWDAPVETKNDGLRRVLFTGGGTGGHVSPNLAMADEIARRHPGVKFLYVGVRGKAEDAMVRRAWDLEGPERALSFVRSRGFPGASNPVALARFGLDLFVGIVVALGLVLRYRPQVVVATGGFVAAPILFAAYGLRRVGLYRGRIFIHEQNAVLGRMNQLAVRFADSVGVAFPETRVPAEKKLWVGYPVRPSVADPRPLADRRRVARESLGIAQDARVILAFGGSQGARTLNRALVDVLPRLLVDPRVVVLHGTGRMPVGGSYNGASDVEQRLERMQGLPPNVDDVYRRQEFIHDMGTHYAAADLVLCRGGAGSLNEVCANGIASVVIPKANLPGDHQAANARSLERRGAVKVVYEQIRLVEGQAQEMVDPDRLFEAIQPLLTQPVARSTMAAAAKKVFEPRTLGWIADMVEHLCLGSPPAQVPEPPPAPDEKILGLSSNQMDQLLRRVRTGTESLEGEDRALALYKIDGYLAAPDYVSRARGCRMVGSGGFKERLEALVSYSSERQGAEFVQPPIVRRDAFRGLQSLGVVDERVLEALESGLKDPYFETRAKAAQAIGGLGGEDHPLAIDPTTGLAQRLNDPRVFQPLLAPLQAMTRDRFFEARARAVRALGWIALDYHSVAGSFQGLAFDSRWKVRVALIEGLHLLVDRGILSADDAAAEAEAVLRTSDGFETRYSFKRAYNELLSLRDGAS